MGGMKQLVVVNMDVYGDEALTAMFKQLPDQVQRQALRPALKKGASKLRVRTRQEIRKRVKKHTGNLLDSVIVENISKGQTTNASGATVGLIAFQVTFSRRNGKKGYHAHLVEYGHRIVSRRPGRSFKRSSNAAKGKRQRRKKELPQLRGGRVKGRGFFRAAIGKSRNEIQDIIQTRFREVLLKSVRKQKVSLASKVRARRTRFVRREVRAAFKRVG